MSESCGSCARYDKKTRKCKAKGDSRAAWDLCNEHKGKS